MTISSTTRVAGPFVGDDTVVNLDFTFKVFDDSEVQILSRLDSTGVDTELVLGADYTVALNADQDTAPGGRVTLSGPLATGRTAFIVSEVSPLQESVFTNTGGFYPSVLNDALDRLHALHLENREVNSRAVVTPVGETGNLALPPVGNRVGKYLYFDVNGDIVASEGTDAGTAIGAVTAVLASTAPGEGVDLVGGAVSGLKSVTNKFITNIDGGVVNRIGDRVFVGGANANDGNYPNTTKDWYTTYEVAQGRPDGIIVSSQAAILTNNYSGAAVGLIVAARTSNLGVGVGGAVGFECHVVNDNTTTAHDGWAGYSEATRDADGVGAIITWEMDARNKGLYHGIGPVNQNAKQSVVLQIASGAALGSGGVTDVSAGINFRENPTKFGAGIVFGSNAIRGTDGSTGSGNAILIGPRQRITWTDLSDNETGSIQSTITSTANKTRLTFSDVGTVILGPTDNICAVFRPVTNAVNYFDFNANTAGNAPVLKATGSDTNVDLQIEPKGTGLLRFGTATSMVANGSVATVLGSLGPAGSHTTVQKWLAVKDSAGTQLYIPCF